MVALLELPHFYTKAVSAKVLVRCKVAGPYVTSHRVKFEAKLCGRSEFQAFNSHLKAV